MWTFNSTIPDKFANSTPAHTPAHTLAHTPPFKIRAVQDGASPNQCTLSDFDASFIAEAARGSSHPAPKLMRKWIDAMQLSKRPSNATLGVSPLGRKAMSAKVLSLSREGIRASVRVEPSVIKILEDFLDEARCGEIIAGAIVLVRKNATICSAISAPHGGRHHLVAACNYLKQDIIAETDN